MNDDFEYGTPEHNTNRDRVIVPITKAGRKLGKAGYERNLDGNVGEPTQFWPAGMATAELREGALRYHRKHLAVLQEMLPLRPPIT